MNENKRKQIEAKLVQLVTQIERDPQAGPPARTMPPIVKVIRRRKGRSDLHVA